MSMTHARVQVSHRNICSLDILVTYTNAKVDSPQIRLEADDLGTHLVSEVGVVTVEWLLVVAEDTETHASRRACGTRSDMEASSETPPEKKTTLHLRTVGRRAALAALGCPTRPFPLADDINLSQVNGPHVKGTGSPAPNVALAPSRLPANNRGCSDVTYDPFRLSTYTYLPPQADQWRHRRITDTNLLG